MNHPHQVFDIAATASLLRPLSALAEKKVNFPNAASFENYVAIIFKAV
jgi:hypothetical protein